MDGNWLLWIPCGRIRRHGLRLLPGDLVAVSEAAPIVGDGEPPLLLEEEDQDDDGADTMGADGDGEIPNEEGKGRAHNVPTRLLTIP